MDDLEMRERGGQRLGIQEVSMEYYSVQTMFMGEV